MPTFVLADVQQVTLAVAGADAAGNLKPIFGVPQWTSSDRIEAVLAVTPSADGLAALAVSVAAQPDGAPPVTIAVAAFADPMLTMPIAGALDISVIASPATQLIITPGAPEPKPVV